MSGLELNKIASSILVASLVAMLSGFVANILYKPKLDIDERGYQVELAEGDVASDKIEATPINISELMASANADAAQNTIKKCIACHSFEKGGANKIGPNLWSIVGATKARNKSFSYSKALASAGGTWTEEELFYFLTKPSKFLPGTKMSFAGIRKPEDVANVIAYLKEKAE